jgi:hypothetical protein
MVDRIEKLMVFRILGHQTTGISRGGGYLVVLGLFVSEWLALGAGRVIPSRGQLL